MPAETDRCENTDVERLLNEQLPDPTERAIVLQRLLDSADAANAFAPLAWGVTLHRNGFRLNVGQVETVRFFDGLLIVNMVGSAADEPFSSPLFAPSRGYRSIGRPSFEFIGRPRHYAEAESIVRPRHDAFLQLAATTGKGEPRKGTTHRRSHWPSLIVYARRFCSMQVEQITDGATCSPADIDLMMSGSEGNARLVTHLRRERNRALIVAKKAAVMKTKGNLDCEACGFNFSSAYGDLVEDFCEVHHLTPLSAAADSVITTLDDLAILCSNCHRVIHLSKPVLSIAALSGFVRRG